MATKKKKNETVFETEDWNDEDYDNFLDYLEEIEGINDSEVYDEIVEEEKGEIVPMNDKHTIVTNEGKSSGNISFDTKKVLGGFFGKILQGVSVSFTNNNGSTIGIDNGIINANVTPDSLRNDIRDLELARAKRQIRKLKNKK